MIHATGTADTTIAAYSRHLTYENDADDIKY
jgi:hypothetical protein